MQKNIVIFDIDGTLANGEHRQQFVRAKPKNWPAYNKRMSDDGIHQHVKDIYDALTFMDVHDIYIVSGREEIFRDVTEKWLRDNGIIGYMALYMRPKNDYRSDDIIKEEILNKHFDKSRILCVFDDRPRVIRMWRKNGIPVLDCGLGIEF